MTLDDLTYPQPPPMTAEHADAMRRVVSLWPYPKIVAHYLIAEVVEHLEAMITAPVPSRPAVVQPFPGTDYTTPPGEAIAIVVSQDDHQEVRFISYPDWRTEYKPPALEDCYGDCMDQ